MHRMLGIALFITFTAACNPDRQNNAYVVAAENFTQRCSKSRLAPWNVRAAAAGADCEILVVQTSIILEDSLVEALHYGTGNYGIYDGGVQNFSRNSEFRAVAYKDSTGAVWTYGATTADEAKTLKPCR
ncbi:MAG TPA: hypothetical protein VF911_06655 [Thermoanaerobaculia bacterium]|jgi:hypothetical protein